MQDLIAEKGIGERGQLIRKIYLNYVDPDSEPCLCDCCDEEKACAHLFMVCGDAAVICKDCLKLILNSFDD
jgi:hypothetical protein